MASSHRRPAESSLHHVEDPRSNSRLHVLYRGNCLRNRRRRHGWWHGGARAVEGLSRPTRPTRASHLGMAACGRHVRCLTCRTCGISERCVLAVQGEQLSASRNPQGHRLVYGSGGGGIPRAQFFLPRHPASIVSLATKGMLRAHSVCIRSHHRTACKLHGSSLDVFASGGLVVT